MEETGTKIRVPIMVMPDIETAVLLEYGGDKKEAAPKPKGAMYGAVQYDRKGDAEKNFAEV